MTELFIAFAALCLLLVRRSAVRRFADEIYIDGSLFLWKLRVARRQKRNK